MKGCGPMKISQEEIKKIALLSRLEVKEDKINLIEEMNDDEKTTAYWAKDSQVDPVI